MRRLFGRLAELYAKHHRAIDLVLITAGAAAVKRQIEELHGRLDELGGMVPLDDVVSLREFAPVSEGLGRALGALEDAGLLPEPPVVDVEPLDDDAETVEAPLAPESVQEAPGAP